MSEPAARLLAAALEQAGMDPATGYELIRQVFPFSGVRRLRPPGGGTAIYKQAQAPLDHEHIALRHAHSHGLPVPEVTAAVQQDGWLGMIMTDLGYPGRQPGTRDAAKIAAAIHAVPAEGVLPRLGPDELTAAAARVAALTPVHRLSFAAQAAAAELAAAAPDLAAPADMPPFGMCHSEFHPESVFVSGDQWHTYDLARAFDGPGLIDLASWQGTTRPPSADALANLIIGYVAAGGNPAAHEPRAGLPPERWALGWHRIWAVDYYLSQLERHWIPDKYLPVQYAAIERHLQEAAVLHLVSA